ncbi:MAG TPA: hypothetical protein VMS98_10095 [Thermoanaerobaculia bacterium]|nr:hypothetical protein [Thermoanaerobaculia bacterium]
MRNTLIAALLFAMATTASAQISRIITTPNRGSGTSSFSIGPRLASYSTDFRAGARVDTGRQSGFGLVGEYRSGQFVLDFMWDHDPENGFSLADIIVDVGNYERDRGEATIGYAVTPNLDLQGGIRFDSVRIGGASFFGNPLFSALEVQHQAITAGVKIHTGDGNPIGWYGVGRGYLGSADFDVAGLGVNPDTTGFRLETGISIRLGTSSWYAVPGIEYEKIQTDEDFGLELDTNRVFVSFVYRMR